jgi:hypothetical protein
MANPRRSSGEATESVFQSKQLTFATNASAGLMQRSKSVAPSPPPNQKIDAGGRALLFDCR